MKLSDYIKGDRRGKEAHRIEKDAMDDPFLSEALEGFDSVEGDHAEAVERLRRRVAVRTASRRARRLGWTAGAVAAVILLLLVIGERVLFREQDNKLTTSADKIVVPDSAASRQGHVAVADREPDKAPEPAAIPSQDRKPVAGAEEKPHAAIAADGTVPVTEYDLPVTKEHQSGEHASLPSPGKPVVAADVINIVADDKKTGQTFDFAEADSVIEMPGAAKAEAVYAEETTGTPVPPLSESVRQAQVLADRGDKRLSDDIRGRVVDEEGEPLIGVAAVLPEKSIGDVTDAQGNFELPRTVPGDTIWITYLGYEPVAIPMPDDSSSLVITMKHDPQAIEDVVVVGYGQQKKVSVTGSVSTVTGILQSRQQPSGVSALSGSRSGLQPKLQPMIVEQRQWGDYLTADIKGRIINEDGEPVIGAAVDLSRTGIADVTGPQGNFELPLTTPNDTIKITYLGYEPVARIMPDGPTEMLITLKRDPAEIGDVVVADGQGDGIAINPQTTISNGMPEEGINAYLHYLDADLIPQYDKAGEKITGKVLLEFSVDRRGRPSGIKIVESLSDKADKEAVRLLKNGPGWLRSNKPVRISVEF